MNKKLRFKNVKSDEEFMKLKIESKTDSQTSNIGLRVSEGRFIQPISLRVTLFAGANAGGLFYIKLAMTTIIEKLRIIGLYEV